MKTSRSSNTSAMQRLVALWCLAAVVATAATEGGEAAETESSEQQHASFSTIEENPHLSLSALSPGSSEEREKRAASADEGNEQKENVPLPPIDQIAEEDRQLFFVVDPPRAAPLMQDSKPDPRGSLENQEDTDYEKTINMDISPADELRLAALKSGYNITDMMLNLATTGTDEELTELLPKPLAEALIDRRRRPDLRDRMIGMTFLGQPVPLDRRLRRPFGGDRRNGENRRRMKLGLKRRQHPNFNRRNKNEFTSSEASPRLEILKPVPIRASRTRIIFPGLSGLTGGPNHPRNRYLQGIQMIEHQSAPLPGFSFNSNDRRAPGFPFAGRGERLQEIPFDGPKSRTFKRPTNNHHGKFGDRPSGSQPFEVFDLREEPAHHAKFDIRRPLENFPRVNDGFGNSVGPDFGPVIYEFEYNRNDDNPNSFLHFDSTKIPNILHKNSRPLKTSSSSQTPRRPPPFSQRPKPFAPSKPFSTSFTNFGGKPSQSHPNSIRNSIGNRDKKSGCTQYTETICLDADNYPHTEILASLEGDKARANVLMAEVRNQSADNLVDGISARQEALYDYSHYFGNNIRRQDSSNHRDFAEEGGYLCPSEVKYARPKRARNSKGQWKFIVNMDKYTQTIRMEKCIQPGGACSYVSHHYQAMCNQIHNYQRLLSWEKKRGLHMDIFKVPSCCTCHIRGYSFVFPPLDDEKKPQHRQQTKAGSRTVESRLPSDQLQGRDVHLGRNQFPDVLLDEEFPDFKSNGGPFTTSPHGGRRLQSPFDRSTFRANRTRRPGAQPHPSDIRRMDASETFESRRNVGRGGTRRPIGGGGLMMSDSVTYEDRGRPGRPGDRQMDARHINHKGVSQVMSFSNIRRGAERGPGEAMDTSQSSINYDYHPILQFFENYPQPQ